MELYEHLEMSRPFSLALFDRPELSRQESAVLSTTTQKDLYKIICEVEKLRNSSFLIGQINCISDLLFQFFNGLWSLSKLVKILTIESKSVIPMVS